MTDVHRSGRARGALVLAALVTTATLIVATGQPDPARAVDDASGTGPPGSVSGSSTVHTRHRAGDAGPTSWTDRASGSSSDGDHLDGLDKLGDLTSPDALNGPDDPDGMDGTDGTDNLTGPDDRGGADNLGGDDDLSPAGDTPTARRHWYIVPMAANACRLNLRAEASVSSPVRMRLRTCGKGPWCWYQRTACGADSRAERIGGTYRCLDEDGAVISSDRWLAVALTSRRRAYVAADCATSVLA